MHDSPYRPDHLESQLDVQGVAKQIEIPWIARDHQLPGGRR